jgi:hypothetical protein
MRNGKSALTAYCIFTHQSGQTGMTVLPGLLAEPMAILTGIDKRLNHFCLHKVAIELVKLVWQVYEVMRVVHRSGKCST